MSKNDRPRSIGFLYALLPAIVVSPALSSYLRRHHVATPLWRALIVGLVAALLTLLAMGIAHLVRPRPATSTRSRVTPLIALIALIAMALGSIASDWISARLD